MKDIDLLIFTKLNQFAGKNGFIDKAAVFFAEYFGYFLVFILLLALIKNFKKFWPMVFQALLSAIVARFVIVEIIHQIFFRSRPFVDYDVFLIFQHPATSSFPSGHAAFFFALSAIVYFYNKKAGSLFLIASFLIAISRVFSGVHWPFDILGGMLIGIITAWLIHRILSKKEKTA